MFGWALYSTPGCQEEQLVPPSPLLHLQAYALIHGICLLNWVCIVHSKSLGQSGGIINSISIMPEDCQRGPIHEKQ